MKRLLTIAGSDSGGGAGIQADLKTFHAFGCYGMSVITAVTAQNTQGVQGIAELDADFVALQLDSVLSDIGADAAKIGMLSSAAIIERVAQKLSEHDVPFLVVDPVMRAKSGDSLLRPEAQQVFVERMLPLAFLLTPNIPEAEVIADMAIRTLDDMKTAAQRIQQKGAAAVLVKGGHRQEDATDILYDGHTCTEFAAERILSTNTHGTGCTYSAAIAANLALGHSLAEAVRTSKKFVTAAIAQSFALGKGVGPLNHFVKPEI